MMNLNIYRGPVWLSCSGGAIPNYSLASIKYTKKEVEWSHANQKTDH
jgi:hypothetical protein